MAISPFGVRLWRLLSHRRPTLDTSIEQMQAVVADGAGVSGVEFAAVVEGAVPSPELVRKLAPALGIHAADLFVFAGLTVPDDLASAWPTSPYDVGSILRTVVDLDAEQCGRLEALVGSLAVPPHAGSTPADDYVTAFAHLLGYRPGDVVALIGVGPVVEDATVHPAHARIAALAWQARQLGGEQLREVMTAAMTMYRDRIRPGSFRSA